VFEAKMNKRFPLLIAAAAAGLAVLPSLAAAQMVELGKTSTPISAPACPKGVSPSQCFIILTRTTAIQTISDGAHYPITVKKNGWLVAFTVGLSNLSSSAKTERSFLHTLNNAYGGAPELAISVLNAKKNNTYTLAAESQMFKVTPFLGQVLQEPFSLPSSFTQFTALRVKKGQLIGLTVPTWAPVLSYNLSPSRFSYRQSRRANCKNAAAGQTAQTTIGATQQYRCNYTGTRVEYSVTEVVDKPAPKTFVH
jgi:hypothetical protein